MARSTAVESRDFYTAAAHGTLPVSAVRHSVDTLTPFSATTSTPKGGDFRFSKNLLGAPRACEESHVLRNGGNPLQPVFPQVTTESRPSSAENFLSGALSANLSSLRCFESQEMSVGDVPREQYFKGLTCTNNHQRSYPLMNKAASQSSYPTALTLSTRSLDSRRFTPPTHRCTGATIPKRNTNERSSNKYWSSSAAAPICNDDDRNSCFQGTHHGVGQKHHHHLNHQQHNFCALRSNVVAPRGYLGHSSYVKRSGPFHHGPQDKTRRSQRQQRGVDAIPAPVLCKAGEARSISSNPSNSKGWESVRSAALLPDMGPLFVSCAALDLKSHQLICVASLEKNRFCELTRFDIGTKQWYGCSRTRHFRPPKRIGAAAVVARGHLFISGGYELSNQQHQVVKNENQKTVSNPLVKKDGRFILPSRGSSVVCETSTRKAGVSREQECESTRSPQTSSAETNRNGSSTAMRHQPQENAESMAYGPNDDSRSKKAGSSSWTLSGVANLFGYPAWWVQGCDGCPGLPGENEGVGAHLVDALGDFHAYDINRGEWHVIVSRDHRCLGKMINASSPGGPFLRRNIGGSSGQHFCNWSLSLWRSEKDVSPGGHRGGCPTSSEASGCKVVGVAPEVAAETEFPCPRAFHTLVRYGELLILFGGENLSGSSKKLFNDIWLFDLKTTQWISITTLCNKKETVGESPAQADGQDRSVLHIESDAAEIVATHMKERIRPDDGSDTLVSSDSGTFQEKVPNDIGLSVGHTPLGFAGRVVSRAAPQHPRALLAKMYHHRHSKNPAPDETGLSSLLTTTSDFYSAGEESAGLLNVGESRRATTSTTASVGDGHPPLLSGKMTDDDAHMGKQHVSVFGSESSLRKTNASATEEDSMGIIFHPMHDVSHCGALQRSDGHESRNSCDACRQAHCCCSRPEFIRQNSHASSGPVKESCLRCWEPFESSVTWELHGNVENSGQQLEVEPQKAFNTSLLSPDHPRAPEQRSGHIAVVYEDKMYVFGGQDPLRNIQFDDLWSFDLKSYKWEKLCTSGPAPEARFGHVGVISGNKLYVHGGLTTTDVRRRLKRCGPVVRPDDWSFADGNAIFILNLRTLCWTQHVFLGQAPEDARYFSPLHGFISNGCLWFGGATGKLDESLSESYQMACVNLKGCSYSVCDSGFMNGCHSESAVSEAEPPPLPTRNSVSNSIQSSRIDEHPSKCETTIGSCSGSMGRLLAQGCRPRSPAIPVMKEQSQTPFVSIKTAIAEERDSHRKALSHDTVASMFSSSSWWNLTNQPRIDILPSQTDWVDTHSAPPHERFKMDGVTQTVIQNTVPNNTGDYHGQPQPSLNLLHGERKPPNLSDQKVVCSSSKPQNKNLFGLRFDASLSSRLSAFALSLEDHKACGEVENVMTLLETTMKSCQDEKDPSLPQTSPDHNNATLSTSEKQKSHTSPLRGATWGEFSQSRSFSIERTSSTSTHHDVTRTPLRLLRRMTVPRAQGVGLKVSTCATRGAENPTNTLQLSADKAVHTNITSQCRGSGKQTQQHQQNFGSQTKDVCQVGQELVPGATASEDADVLSSSSSSCPSHPAQSLGTVLPCSNAEDDYAASLFPGQDLLLLWSRTGSWAWPSQEGTTKEPFPRTHDLSHSAADLAQHEVGASPSTVGQAPAALEGLGVLALLPPSTSAPSTSSLDTSSASSFHSIINDPSEGLGSCSSQNSVSVVSANAEDSLDPPTHASFRWADGSIFPVSGSSGYNREQFQKSLRGSPEESNKSLVTTAGGGIQSVIFNRFLEPQAQVETVENGFDSQCLESGVWGTQLQATGLGEQTSVLRLMHRNHIPMTTDSVIANKVTDHLPPFLYGEDFGAHKQPPNLIEPHQLSCSIVSAPVLDKDVNVHRRHRCADSSLKTATSQAISSVSEMGATSGMTSNNTSVEQAVLTGSYVPSFSLNLSGLSPYLICPTSTHRDSNIMLTGNANRRTSSTGTCEESDTPALATKACAPYSSSSIAAHALMELPRCTSSDIIRNLHEEVKKHKEENLALKDALMCLLPYLKVEPLEGCANSCPPITTTSTTATQPPPEQPLVPGSPSQRFETEKSKVSPSRTSSDLSNHSSAAAFSSHPHLWNQKTAGHILNREDSEMYESLVMPSLESQQPIPRLLSTPSPEQKQPLLAPHTYWSADSLLVEGSKTSELFPHRRFSWIPEELSIMSKSIDDISNEGFTVHPEESQPARQSCSSSFALLHKKSSDIRSSSEMYHLMQNSGDVHLQKLPEPHFRKKQWLVGINASNCNTDGDPHHNVSSSYPCHH